MTKAQYADCSVSADITIIGTASTKSGIVFRRKNGEAVVTTARYECAVIGDGESLDTAFRPALADHCVVKKLTCTYDVEVGDDGKPVSNSVVCEITAEEAEHETIKNLIGVKHLL